MEKNATAGTIGGMNELDQLEGLAAIADEGAKALDPVDPNAPVPPPPTNYAVEAQGTVAMLAALITGYAPACAPLWGQEVQDRISGALAPVMEKYSFSLGAMPPELTLIVVAGPVLYQSSKVIAKQMNADKAESEAKAQAQATEQKTGTTTAPPQAETPELAVAPQMALYKS